MTLARFARLPGPWDGSVGRGPAALVLAVSLLLAACTTPPGPAPAPPAAPPSSAPRAGEPAPPRGALSPLDQFESTQRTAAEAASRRGRWSEAIWAWDVVLALKPNDAEALAARRSAEASAQAAVAERLPRAAQARARGDIDQATRLYLEVLALSPGHTEAADALRAMERDRSRRQAVGPFARAPSMVTPVASARNAAAKPGQRLDLEHASLLADAGEIDAAIATLQPATTGRSHDPEARALIADLYVRQADKLAPSDRAGAIRALRLGLQAVPGHALATQRLRQLQAAAGGAVPAPALSRPSAGPSSGR